MARGFIKEFFEWKSGSKLDESLPVSMAKEFTSVVRPADVEERLDKLFKGLASLPGSTQSKRGDRVYFDFVESVDKTNAEKSTTELEIEKAFDGTDYTTLDYLEGTVQDKYKRTVKIGTALKKIGRSDLIDDFNGDKKRTLVKSKAEKKYIVFSKHKYDIAGMSGGRGWTSCTNVIDRTKGFNWRKVPIDIEHGSFICYLIKASDMNINNPQARVLFKPLVNVKNEKDIIYVADCRYGTATPEFGDYASQIVDEVQETKRGRFSLKSHDIYTDMLHGEREIHSRGYNAAMRGESMPKTIDVVEEIIEHLGIKNFKINDDLTVDVDGNVDLSSKWLVCIPLQFGTVTGDFVCDANPIKSLVGSPRSVGGFSCAETKIKDLVGCPSVVTNNFSCDTNNLESLKGSPRKIGGAFMCYDTGITSLEGSPDEIGGTFDCSFNRIVSFDGAPSFVKDEFSCIQNKPALTEEQKQQIMKAVKAGSFDI